MKFGEKVRYAREERLMSQSEMAAAIPMNQSNYSKIERGLQEPSLTQFKRIVQILELDANFLLGITDQQEDEPLSFSEQRRLAKLQGK